MKKTAIKIFSSTQILIFLDDFSRELFKPSNFNTTTASNNQKIKPIKENIFEFLENRKSKIFSSFLLEPLKGELNYFDRIIFTVAESLRRAGREIFSVNELYKLLGGNARSLGNSLREEISESLEKMACTRFRITMTEINRRNKYSDNLEVDFKSTVLPTKSVTLKRNGKICDGVFQFLDNSPLFQSIELRKQLTACSADLLQVPRLRSTRQTIMIKFYLLERVVGSIGSHKEHKQHFIGKTADGVKFKTVKPQTKIIKLETLLQVCELSDANKWQFQDVRNTIEKTLNHFKNQGLITDWNFTIKDKKIYSVQFDFMKKT